jgi:hypothetical protein
LIAVLSIVAISVTLFGVWARRIVSERARLQIEEVRQQAISLAEAGAQRAIARLNMDSTFTSEDWTVTAKELGNGHTGVVHLKVIASADQRRVEATAEYPIGALRSVQITKTIELPVATSAGES